MSTDKGAAPVTPDSAAAQLAIARRALHLIAQPGDDDAEPARQHAAGTLKTMDRLAEPVPAGAAEVRAEVLAQIAVDWTINPETGSANSSAEYLHLVTVVDRLMQREFRVIDTRAIASTARLIMAQLAHVHGLAPRETAGVISREDLRLVLRMAADYAAAAASEGLSDANSVREARAYARLTAAARETTP